MPSLKEGDLFKDEYGVFRVAIEAYPGTGCTHCDHVSLPCIDIKCTTDGANSGGFILLTEINYVTRRLTS